jgi:hypothetical protein
MQGNPAGMTVHYLQCPAMSHHHSFPGKAISDTGKSFHHPGNEVQRLLAARDYAIGIECPVAGIDFWVQYLRFGTDESLQYAKIALSESRITNDSMIGTGSDTLRGLMRTTQIAAVERSGGLARQPRCARASA